MPCRAFLRPLRPPPRSALAVWVLSAGVQASSVRGASLTRCAAGGCHGPAPVGSKAWEDGDLIADQACRDRV